MILRLVLLVMGLGALAACISKDKGSPYTETGAVCDQAGLESQLRDFRDMSRSLKGALGVGTENWGVAGSYETTNIDVERRYELRDKMLAFDAEVDAQFRNVTSSCKAFSRCMEMNRYNENKCRTTMRRWDDAERSFSNLAVDLRRLRVDVVRIENQRPIIIEKTVKKPCKDDCCEDECRDRHKPKKHKPKECCDTLGTIFTDCCG